VESLKIHFNHFFEYLNPQSFRTCTAGIVPSVHTSKHYGRVLFYDFAGDPEYYSSHAAILENLASSKTGINLIIIVVDLRSNKLTAISYYWLSFIQHQKFKTKTKLAFIGSHSDSLPKEQVAEKKRVLEKLGETLSIQSFMLDCRKPRSGGMESFRNHVSTWASSSPPHRLSDNARLLLGLLEKDFSNVTACPLQTIQSHIRDCGVCLPTEAGGICHTLSELHDIGVLLLLVNHTKGDCHVVLNSPKLTNEVHKLLFSESADSAPFNIGIFPNHVLEDILPPYITTQCLSCLQYCQEIEYKGTNVSTPIQSSDQSFFFFPALCKKDRSEVS
jgi:hypothetical protein